MPRRALSRRPPAEDEERMRAEYWERDCAPVLDAIAAWLGPPFRPLARSHPVALPDVRKAGPF